jgi:hypothetical protein
MYYYIAIAVIVLVVLFVIYKFNINDEQEIDSAESEKKEDIKPEKSKEVILHFNTDLAKFSFYNTDIFKNYRAGQLYKKVVVTKLFIDEPFHTVFTQLLQIYAHTHSWIKSSKTKEIRLKIRTKDAKFEEGISFKVYSISEIVFDLLENILEHFDKKKNKKKRYTKEDQKNIILSVLIWKLDCVKEFKYLCDKNLNDIKFRECLAKKILREYDENHNIFQILQMLEEGHKKVQFIFRLHDRAMKWQQEYPYVSKGEEEYIKINIDKLANQHMKNLMRVDSFSVY